MLVEDMQRFRKVVTESALNEAYEDRVKQVADEVADLYGTITTKDAAGKITDVARRLNITEVVRVGGSIAKEFIKDVYAVLKERGLTKRASSVRPKKPGRSEDDQKRIASKVEQFAGEIFPDGEPNDLLIYWFRKQGWDPYDILDNVLPNVMKKYFGVSSLSDYMADLYDQVKADNPDLSYVQGRNPWR